MKRVYSIYIVLLAVGLSLTSCENWLDVQPADTVTEEDLFKEGTGYRNALNGVYRDLSSTSLFGRELTWGVAEALAQSYGDSYNTGNSPFASDLGHSDIIKYDYTTDQAKKLISSIWGKAYNVIANCNNIIGRIEKEPDGKFKGGKLERELILGEALAARAFLHFEMLVYFAPAPVTNPSGNWIPYYEKFPQIGAEYRTVEGILELVTRDLKRAQSLVEPFDTFVSDDENHRMWLHPDYRFSSSAKFPSIPQTTDGFYAYRGYRMNYLAITAILARAYSYGSQYDLAAAEAQKVIDFSCSEMYKALSYTPESKVKGNFKMSDDLIFALSDSQLLDHYKTFNSGKTKLTLNMDYYDPYYNIFDAESDYRGKLLLTEDADWDVIGLRYIAPKTSNEYTTIVADILPVVRLSEMHYILAEECADRNSFGEATAMLDQVRVGRGCPSGLLDGAIRDKESFVEELLNETRREFLEEGLIFFYYKKMGKRPSASMTEEQLYFPLPDNETVN